MSVTARIYFVRHGETDENRTGIIQGQLDTKLNEKGIHQSEKVARALKDVKFDRAYSSDLSRAVRVGSYFTQSTASAETDWMIQTAEIILGYHPSVKLEKLADLRERNMGEMQGFTVEEALRRPRLKESEIEQTARFANRAVTWWNKAVQRLASLPTQQGREPHHVLIVTHGGFIGTLIGTLLESRKLVKDNDAVDVGGGCLNTSVSIVRIESGSRKGILERYGDAGHLGLGR